MSVNPALIGGPSTASSNGKPKKIPLNSNDKLVAEIRDLNFATVGNVLSKSAKRLHEDYEVFWYSTSHFVIFFTKERHQAKTVSQIKDFVGKLGGLQTEHQALRLRKSFLSGDSGLIP